MDSSDMTDWQRWVEDAQRGDRDAYGALVRRFQAMAVGYAYSIILDFAQAEDAAQEAFLEAYVDLAKLRHAGAFPGWFRRIVFSQCTRYLRGRRLSCVPLDLALELPDAAANGPHAAVERRETQAAVRAAIHSLTDDERAAVTLFYMGGYSHQEIGSFLNVPAARIKSRLHEARSRLRERMTNIMEETLHEKAPGEAFHRKVLERVERLAWGVSGECTFAGALASATGATAHPYDYQWILGVTGLAFRTRWFHGPGDATGPRWCPSSPVGEFPEEVKAARRATGWALRPEDWSGAAPVDRLAPEIVRSIDAGLPVLGYDAMLNMAVICGYEDEGRTVLFQGYQHGASPGNNAPQRLSTTDLKMFVLFLGKHDAPLTPRDAALQGITMAVTNWPRRHDPADNEARGYWFGRTALEKWAADISLADTLAEEHRGLLFFVSWWTFDVLADARQHAGPFLREAATLFPQADRPALDRAAALYDREADLLARSFVSKDAFLGPWSGKSINDWDDATRRREQQMLADAAAIEEEAVAALSEVIARHERSA